jgi:hypothetical protein
MGERIKDVITAGLESRFISDLLKQPRQVFRTKLKGDLLAEQTLRIFHGRVFNAFADGMTQILCILRLTRENSFGHEIEFVGHVEHLL